MSVFTCSNVEKDRFDLLLFIWLTMRHLSYLYVNYDEIKKIILILHLKYKIASVEILKNILKQELHSVNNKIKKYLQKKIVVETLLTNK
jgi:hypothetical protein